MAFRVGQKVVCIGGTWHGVAARIPWACPELKSVYIVRTIETWSNGRGTSLRFSEIRNEPIGGFEPSFSSEYFRPVVERKTDISIFTALLTPNKRERADA